MWQYILTINLRRALRMKFHQMAGLTGLVVAFTVSAAIFLYLHNELSYETGYQHSNHIYRVILHGKMGGSEFDAAVCGAPMGPHFMAEIPGVKAFTRLFNIPGTKLVSFEDKKIYEEQILYVDSMFFRVFGHSFLEGDETNCLNEPNTIVLVKSFAEKYFSNQPALGRILTLDGKKYKVTGVVSNPDQPTHLRFKGLISLSTLNDHPRYGQYLKTPFAFITTTYLLLRPGLKPTDIQTNIDRVVDKYMNFPDSTERVSSILARSATGRRATSSRCARSRWRVKGRSRLRNASAAGAFAAPHGRSRRRRQRRRTGQRLPDSRRPACAVRSYFASK